MQLGTHIRLRDGREGTITYNSLCGYGGVWGLHDPDPLDFVGSDGDSIASDPPEGFQWEPEFLLREPYDGCERTGFSRDQLVGEEFEIIQGGDQ